MAEKRNPKVKFIDPVKRLKYVEVRGEIIRVKELVDDYRYQVNVAEPGTGEMELFQSKSVGQGQGVRLARANFAASQSLVKDKLLFEVHAIFILPIGRPITQEEAHTLYDDGQYTWMQDASIADRGVMRLTLGGPAFKGLVGGANLLPLIQAEIASGEFSNVRRYAIPRIAVGGQTTEMKLEWPFAGHLSLTQPLHIGTFFYGTILKPLDLIPPAPGEQG